MRESWESNEDTIKKFLRNNEKGCEGSLTELQQRAYEVMKAREVSDWLKYTQKQLKQILKPHKQVQGGKKQNQAERLHKYFNDTTPPQILRLLSFGPSSTGSQTATGGYKEEEWLIGILNSSQTLREALSIPNNVYSKGGGNGKSDVKSRTLKAQIKKSRKKTKQQLDRQWVRDIVAKIPALKPIEHMLIAMCEIPLLPDNKYVDEDQGRKELNLSNYSQEQLDHLINVLNCNKRQFLELVFLGSDTLEQPDVLLGVEYANGTRTQVIKFKISDIIDHLTGLDFKITDKACVIKLGDAGTLTLQRKGGDSKRKSGNHLATHIIVSNLIGKVPCKTFLVRDL